MLKPRLKHTSLLVHQHKSKSNQCLFNIHQNITMSAVSVIFLVSSIICIIIQITNPVKIQNSWIHNTKLLCVKHNESYVANSTCSLKLISRSTELSNINIVLQPNIILRNLHVTLPIHNNYNIILL